MPGKNFDIKTVAGYVRLHALASEAHHRRVSRVPGVDPIAAVRPSALGSLCSSSPASERARRQSHEGIRLSCGADVL